MRLGFGCAGRAILGRARSVYVLEFSRCCQFRIHRFSEISCSDFEMDVRRFAYCWSGADPSFSALFEMTRVLRERGIVLFQVS